MPYHCGAPQREPLLTLILFVIVLSQIRTHGSKALFC
jgi:hypothetical protein